MSSMILWFLRVSIGKNYLVVLGRDSLPEAIVLFELFSISVISLFSFNDFGLGFALSVAIGEQFLGL
jgi:hypothetical protein